PLRVERWRRELAYETRLKVGLVWRGSPQYISDRQRSAELSHLRPLAGVPGVALFSLQFGPGGEEVMSADFPITDLGSRSTPMENLAALLLNLDLLISVDTAPAHLAGALGVPYWLALPNVPDWRWMLDRSDSPWYPTARLFRQREPGNWNS